MALLTRLSPALLRCDVLFEKVEVLEAEEFDREAIVEMTDHTRRRLADGDGGRDFRPMFAPDRGARLRNVGYAHHHARAIRKDQPRRRIARRDSTVAAILRQTEDMAVGQPGKLRSELVALYPSNGCVASSKEGLGTRARS